MYENSFSTETTEELFAQLTQAPAIKTIEEIYMPSSVNLDSDAGCQALCAFLASASALKECNIMEQTGDRKICVRVDCATDETETGSVTACYKLPIDISICSVPTQRREQIKEFKQ